MTGSAIRVGVIGAGWWATTLHLPQLAKRPDVELVAVCRLGRRPLESIQQQFGFAYATEDYRELFQHNLDAVVVASPHDLHATHALAALEAGCHVLCEKPLALRPEEAWQLVAEAARRGLQLVVSLGWHCTPFLRTAREMLADGAVGRIEFVSCRMASPMLGLLTGSGDVPIQWTPETMAPEPSTWADPDRGGGYAYGQLPHSLGLLFWLTGLRATSASAVSATGDAPVDLYWAAHAVLSGDVPLSLSGAGSLPRDDKFQIEIQVFGREGALLVDVERERLELRRRDGRHVHVPVEPGAGAYSCEAVPGYFVDLIRGHETENLSPGEIGARSIELIDALYRSARSDGMPVDIDASEGS